MKLNKFFMLGLAGLAFAACSNENEVADGSLMKGTKQVSVTISTGNYVGTRAGSGWTDGENNQAAITPANIKVYLLDKENNVIQVEDATVGSTNVYHNIDPVVTQIAAIANCTVENASTWNAVLATELNIEAYGDASEAPLCSEVADLEPSGTDAADGNTMYTATVTLKTMLSRIELRGDLTCSNLGASAYTELSLTHVGLNGVYEKFTLAGNTAGENLRDISNQTGYPVNVSKCFYDVTTAPVINTIDATALGADYGYNFITDFDELLLQFNTVFKDPIAEGYIVYNPAYLKIVGLNDANGASVTIEPGKIYQITDLTFTEEDLTDLDPNEPTICVTATVNVQPWDIVAVTPEYGE